MPTSSFNDKDALVEDLIEDYFSDNVAARTYRKMCKSTGCPFTIDHITLRCLDVARRAVPFLERGYVDADERVEYPDQGWWAKVYRREGHPALFIDQAYADARGAVSIIPAWVDRFGDQRLHHVAVRVVNIDTAITALKERDIAFSGTVVGALGSRLRQIFTVAEIRAGVAFSVLELTERNGYDGFYPEQAGSLMQASTRLL